MAISFRCDVCRETVEVVSLEAADAHVRSHPAKAPTPKAHKSIPWEDVWPISEADFQADVIAYATEHGWLVHHDRPARTADGEWRTHIAGHAGFPDLVLARGGVVLLVELKAGGGRLSEAQQKWRDESGSLVWYPADWTEIARLLKR